MKETNNKTLTKAFNDGIIIGVFNYVDDGTYLDQSGCK